MRILARILAASAAATFACLVYLYLTLPDVRPLRAVNPTTTAFLELRAREARGRGQPPPRPQQRWVPYDRISLQLKRAVLVAEDSGFWQHEGIDAEQIRDSIEINFEKRAFARGASTITQQLAKNLYLSPSKNPFRKLQELLIARRLELELSKQRILELYLNVIEWGDAIYGAEMAARTYFHTSGGMLGAEQAALLAAAIMNPHVLNPARPSARLRRRQRLILRRMGHVTPPPLLIGPAELPPLLPPDAPFQMPGRPLPPPEPPPDAPAVPGRGAGSPR